MQSNTRNVEGNERNERKIAIGIDLGTTNSCVGFWNQDRVDIIPNDEGKRTTPSIVSFGEHERYIGNAAQRQRVMNSANTVYEVKRLIGRNFEDPIVQSDIQQWPFNVIELGDNKPCVQVNFKGEDHVFQPEQISAMILNKMRDEMKSV